jgi:hypothetical protein
VAGARGRRIPVEVDIAAAVDGRAVLRAARGAAIAVSLAALVGFDIAAPKHVLQR